MNAKTAWKARPASEKQVAFVQKLTGERDAAALSEQLLESLADLQSGEYLTGGQASALIDALMAAPRKAKAEAKPGYYTLAGEVFVVVQNKAKQMVIHLTADDKKRGSWEYKPGLGAQLAKSVPLTVQEAARLGHLHGVCMICGAALTDPKSVTNGIGPVCAKRL
jgi:Family of unknown function (DUF6011)